MVMMTNRFILIFSIIILVSFVFLCSCDNNIQQYDDKNDFTEQASTEDEFENEVVIDGTVLDSYEEVAEPEPKPKPEPITVITPSFDCLPSKYDLKYDILSDNKLVDEYFREYSISFPDSEDYSELEGVTCFRGNNFRNSPSYGNIDIKEGKLEKVWSLNIGYIDIWTGVGWNGQPAIVKWNNDIKNIMNIYPEKKQKDNLKEVIYATLDGKIYFLDLDDGKATRPPINVGYPHKGSVTVDPRGYPILYAGQGIDKKGTQYIPIGYRIFSLIDQKMLYFLNGRDEFAFRNWGAFDSGGLIDSKTDTLIEFGENGILYTIKLNTSFSLENTSVSIEPDIVKYRYSSPFSKIVGTENSPVIYKNYIYFSDNSGLFQCVDLNTMKPLWVRSVTDDTDSTTVLDEISYDEIYLYTACEVDKQGYGGLSYIRKLDALSGDLIWEVPVKCSYDKQSNGGALASPVIGKKNISNLIIYNIAKTGSNNNGSKLIALYKDSGTIAWEYNMQNYCWSSPVDVYTIDGKAYLIVCDSGGFMNLFDGASGELLHCIDLQTNIEASPAIFDNMIVVGTRGQQIFGVMIK